MRAEAFANLTLADIEWLHMDKILTPGTPEHRKLHSLAVEMKGYDYIYRYVDDSAGLAAAMPLLPPKEVYGLEYSEALESNEIIMVGRRWNTANGGCITSLADKQDAIPFALRRYPHADSTMSMTQRIGCVVVCLCTARTVGRGYNEQFKDAFRTQLAHMFERGFTQRTFRNGINNYINRHTYPSRNDRISKQLIHETLNSTLSSLRGQPYSSGKGKSDHLSKRIQPKKIEKTPKGKPAAAEPSAGAPLGEKQYAGKARDASGWKKVNPRKVTAAEKTGTKVLVPAPRTGYLRVSHDIRRCSTQR